MNETAADFAAQVAATYGGTPQRAGKEWRAECPCHETDGRQHRPSLAIWPTPSGIPAFNCLAGCKWSAVRAALERKGVVIPRSSADARAIEQAAQHDEQAQRIRLARQIFEQGMPLMPNDPSMRYLSKRALVPKDDELRCFRTARGSVLGTWLLLQAIIDPSTLSKDDWRAVGVQLLYLNAAGTAMREGDKKKRRIIGSLKGCGVVIGKPGSEVIIGEGTESVWSAMRLLDCSFGIAALGALNLDRLRLPHFASSIIIASDNDEAGQACAERACEMWRRQRRTVEIVRWGAALSGREANDELRDKVLQRTGAAA